MKSERIKSFDGLRFIVIVCLIAHHFDMFNDLNIDGWRDVMKYFQEGFFSVNFFFILSGFCIALGYSDKIQSGKASCGQFLFNRFAHLYPTYLLCLFGATLLYKGDLLPHFKEKLFWLHILLLQDLVSSSYAFSYNAVAWSVSAEVFFYALFCVVVWMPKRKRWILTAALWGLILVMILLVGHEMPDAIWFFYLSPITRFGDFLLGIILYELSEKKRARETQHSSNTLELLSVGVLIITVIITANTEVSWLWHWQVIYTLPCALLIYAFSLERGILSRFFGHKVFQILGSLAFPIYLTHQMCLFVVKRWSLPTLTSVSALLTAGLFATLLSICCSFLIERLYAKPLNSLMKKWYTKGRKNKLSVVNRN